MRDVRVDADISFTENPRWAGKQGGRGKKKVTKVMGKAPAAGLPTAPASFLAA